MNKPCGHKNTQISRVLKNMEALMQLYESNARDDLSKEIRFPEHADLNDVYNTHTPHTH